MSETVAAKESVADQNGQLTQDDVWRREVARDISVARRKLSKAEGDLEAAKADVKAGKAIVEKWRQELDVLTTKLRDIELQQFQPDLFDREEHEEDRDLPHPDLESPDVVSGTPGLETAAKLHKAAGGDSGKLAPLSVLQQHGLTEKQVEMLLGSELANDFSGLKHVSDLERAISSDEWWHRRVKGLGEKKIDKVTDAISSFRSTHPAPLADDEEDDRVRKCLGAECGSIYSPALSQCPQCGGTTFELVDPPDKAPGFDDGEVAAPEVDAATTDAAQGNGAAASAEPSTNGAEAASEAADAGPEDADEPDDGEPSLFDDAEYVPCNSPEGESPFEVDNVVRYLWPEGGGPVPGTNVELEFASAQAFSGEWYACSRWRINGTQYGRDLPLKTSRPAEFEDEALIAAVDELLRWFGEKDFEEADKLAVKAIQEFRKNCVESLSRSSEAREPQPVG